jgi:hypothetical protein
VLVFNDKPHVQVDAQAQQVCQTQSNIYVWCKLLQGVRVEQLLTRKMVCLGSTPKRLPR